MNVWPPASTVMNTTGPFAIFSTKAGSFIAWDDPAHGTA